MISIELRNKMNEQIGIEFYASNLYLQMSAWALKSGFLGTAKFLRAHSAEELRHGLRFYDFINETSAMAVVPAIGAPPQDFNSLASLFEQILDHEKHVTFKILELANLAHDQRDFLASGFLQHFVEEQHEEEMLFKNILDQIRLIGTDGRGLFFIDSEIGRMKHE